MVDNCFIAKFVATHYIGSVAFFFLYYYIPKGYMAEANLPKVTNSELPRPEGRALNARTVSPRPFPIETNRLARSVGRQAASAAAVQMAEMLARA